MLRDLSGLFKVLAYEMSRLQLSLRLFGVLIISLLGPREAKAKISSGARGAIQGNEIRATADTSLFAATVRWVKTDFSAAKKAKRPLRIDPHPLRSDAELPLDKSDFAEVDSSVLRRRGTVLRRFGVPQRDVLRFSDTCLFTCDPRLVKRKEATRSECPPKRCEVTVVALSLPAHSETETHPDEQTQKTIRVYRSTAFTHFIHDLTFQRTEQSWSMIEKKVVAGGGM